MLYQLQPIDFLSVALLLNFTKKEVPSLQIIVTEHANLRDKWFQNALIEEPWSKPHSLVPEDLSNLSKPTD